LEKKFQTSNFKMKYFVLLSFFFALALAAPLLTVKEPILDNYIVVFHDNVTSDYIDLHVNRLTAVSGNSTMLNYRYNVVLNGFAAKMTKNYLFTLLNDPNVKYVEQDQMMYALPCLSQNPVGSWGIKRISATVPQPPPSTYYYPDTAGSGVTAYIIDTGILVTHNDFGGRAVFGFKATATWSNTDANGHGTHVASTVAGTAYGVAKNANLVAVKVLGDNGSGTNAGVIAGVDWTSTNGGGKKSTANMSLGGGFSQALNDAVDKCHLNGVPVAVAAGNDNRDAANYSPASASQVITVGSTAETQSGGIYSDTRSSFSNYGTKVDIFAPGSSIVAAYIGSNNNIATLSGTSMASPHVCGVATLLVGNGVPVNQVKSTLINTAKTGLVNLNCGGVAACNQSPNRFLYSSC